GDGGGGDGRVAHGLPPSGWGGGDRSSRVRVAWTPVGSRRRGSPVPSREAAVAPWATAQASRSRGGSPWDSASRYPASEESPAPTVDRTRTGPDLACHTSSSSTRTAPAPPRVIRAVPRPRS